MSEQTKTPPPPVAGPEPEPSRPGDKLQRSEQELVRADKYRRLIAAGTDPFPHKAERTAAVVDLVAAHAGKSKEEIEAASVRVIVPGRMMSIRLMGKAAFFHITDGRSKIQAYIRADKVGAEAYERFKLLDIGDFLSVAGELFKTKTGELTVLCESFTFLAKCLYPLPEKWHGLQDIEIRTRRRYLDLMMNPEVVDVFRLRSVIISWIRRFFDSRGYVEVETPMMHAVAGGAMARPFVTHHNALDLELYLRIAPELYLKRLVVGGMEKVYEINRNFRNEGIDAEHNPEFTMLEFYAAYCDYNDMMALTEELFRSICRDLLGKEEFPYGDRVISLKEPFRRIKFRDALAEGSGLPPAAFDDRLRIIKYAEDLAPEKKPVSYGKALDIIFDKKVKERIVQPTFILNPPKEVSPLAKSALGAPEEAARFELMIAGMELANAFSELTDPAEQKARFEQQAEERRKGNEETHPIDLDYVQALEYGLPPTGGEGIGIDRLVMLLANRRSIREVILFPLLRPREET